MKDLTKTKVKTTKKVTKKITKKVNKKVKGGTFEGTIKLEEIKPFKEQEGKKAKNVKKVLAASLALGAISLAGYKLNEYHNNNPGKLNEHYINLKTQTQQKTKDLYEKLFKVNNVTPEKPHVVIPLAISSPTIKSPAPIIKSPEVLNNFTDKQIAALSDLHTEFAKIKLAQGPPNEPVEQLYQRYVKIVEKRCEYAFGERKKMCMKEDQDKNKIDAEKIKQALLEFGIRI